MDIQTITSKNQYAVFHQNSKTFIHPAKPNIPDYLLKEKEFTLKTNFK